LKLIEGFAKFWNAKLELHLVVGCGHASSTG